MSKDSEICPGCHRHCSLTAPRCRVGEAYAKERALREEKNRKKHQDDVLQDSDSSPSLSSRADIDSELAETMRRVSRSIRHGEMTLEILSAEETVLLRDILQKLNAERTVKTNNPAAICPSEQCHEDRKKKHERGKTGQHHAHG